MAKILIVGFGNPLRSDDGLGWNVATKLAKELARKDVRIIAQHQLTPEIAELASRADRVLFIDAAHRGEPGSLRCHRVECSESDSAHSHELSPAAILRLANELYGRSAPAYLLTVAGASFATGDALSPEVEATVPLLLKKIRRFVDSDDEGFCNEMGSE